MEKTKLLIAESNDSVRNALKDYFALSESIETVAVVGDGIEACDKIDELKPDAVIMDIVLPGYDGFAVLERISVFEKRPAVIVYSAFATESFVGKAVRMGADYFMVKPCDFTMLKDRLSEICASRGVAVRPKYTPAVPLKPDRGQKQRSLEERIANIFITVGIPPHIKGYGFLREAVRLCVDDPEIINSITKRLYPSIADKYTTSSSKVERAIRHAIEVAWNRGKMENVNSLFGIKIYSNNEKPTNGEFIALIADKMLLEGA